MRIPRKIQVKKLATYALAAGFVLTLALSVRSFWRLDKLLYHSGARILAVESSNGCVLFFNEHNRSGSTGKPVPFRGVEGLHFSAGAGFGKRSFFWRSLGFRYSDVETGGQNLGDVMRIQLIGIPFWALLLILGIIPAWKFLQFLRKSPQTPNCCPKCRYDLRAHRPGDKCPECGTMVGPEPQVS